MRMARAGFGLTWNMLAMAEFAVCRAAEAAMLALVTCPAALARATEALLERLATREDAESWAAACAEDTALAEATWSCWFCWARSEADAWAATSALLRDDMEVSDRSASMMTVTWRARSEVTVGWERGAAAPVSAVALGSGVTTTTAAAMIGGVLSMASGGIASCSSSTPLPSMYKVPHCAVGSSGQKKTKKPSRHVEEKSARIIDLDKSKWETWSS